MDLYSYTLIDVANGGVAVDSVDAPQTNDAGQLYTAIDYDGETTNQPPIAELAATPTSGEAPLAVSFDGSGSSDTDGSIAGYSWDFGDGHVSSGISTSHTYTSAGTFIAVLTVTDDDGDTDTASATVTVDEPVNQAPTAAISATTTNGVAPLVVPFDGSGSSDADGSIAGYSWNFGDGNFASGISTSHTYTNAGTFTAVLTVIDDDGAMDSASVAITVDEPANQAPTADISATPTSGEAPLTVSFDGSGSSDADGSITNYSWSFGDGSGANGAVVGHTYTSAGQFTAVLTVTDDGDAMDSATVTITVSEPANQAPTADISATPTSGEAPLTVSFDGSGSSDADGSITNYSWSFGDGSGANGALVEHTYKSAGQFTAILTVTDDDGAMDTASVTITVNDASVLNAPVGLTAAVSGNQVSLSWTAVGANADGFHIERAIKYRGKYNFVRIDSVPASATTYVDTVDETGTYRYRVQAYSTSPSSDGVSDYSNEASVSVADVVEPDPEPTPDPVDDFDAPSNLTASIDGASAMLTWTDNTSDETGFIVERGEKITGKISYSSLGQVSADQTTYVDACGAGTFYYRVRAFLRRGRCRGILMWLQ